MLTSYYDGFQFVTDDPVFASTIANGKTEPYPYDIHVVRRYLRAFPSRCRTYVDVGAHIGTTIAPYSRIFKRVVGFEANPHTFTILQENINRNKIQCQIECVGLYSHACRGYIRQHAGGNSGCYYFQEDTDGSIECKTLDEYDLDDVDFLKIDTEGSELLVLKGAKKTIEKCKPFIQVECNFLSDTLFGIQTSTLIDYLTSIGYVLYDKSDANLFFYYPRIEPYTIFCFWTGSNPMSQARKDCIESMRKIGCILRLVTPENLSDYILQTSPLHPAYPYLSEVHKSDYLRTYFMHYYGGGYSDIKQQTGCWYPYFDKLRDSDAYIAGYTEIGERGVGYPPVAHTWNELVGNGAYICRPNTPFTKEWFSAMNAVLDEKLEELRIHPASHPRDKKEDGTGYPIEWNELLGRIFHRVLFDHREKIIHGLPQPLFYGYL